LLDSDDDGQITADQISIAEVPINTIRILQPIFEELDNIEEGIN